MVCQRFWCFSCVVSANQESAPTKVSEQHLCHWVLNLFLPLGTESLSLCAILQHVGDGVNSGHYITTIRHGDETQTRNDGLCTKVTKLPDASDDIWSQEYVFVYKKVFIVANPGPAAGTESGRIRPCEDVPALPWMKIRVSEIPGNDPAGDDVPPQPVMPSQ